MNELYPEPECVGVTPSNPAERRNGRRARLASSGDILTTWSVLRAPKLGDTVLPAPWGTSTSSEEKPHCHPGAEVVVSDGSLVVPECAQFG